MKTIIKDAVILAAFSLVLGLMLGAVYCITKPIIDKNANAKEEQAQQVLFNDGKRFDVVDFDKEKAATVMKNTGYSSITITKVVEAFDASNTKLGFIISIETAGYKAGLKMSIGIAVDGTVKGFQVFEHQETAGYGKDVIESNFGEQFKDVKTDKFEKGVNVDFVSGATVTSTTLTDAVNAAILYCKDLTGGLVIKTPQEMVFENATELKDIEVNAGLVEGIISAGGYNDELTGVSEAYGEDGTLLGYVLTVKVNDSYGKTHYQKDMILAIGIQLDGTFNGYAAIEHGETKGFGTQVFDDAFSSQFVGVNTEKFVANENVDLISGSTISSTAILNACNFAIECFKGIVGGAQ